jgi:hypothetical protein
MAVTLNASTSAGLVQSADLSGAINIQSNGTTVLGVTSTGTSVTGTQSVSGAQSVSGNLSFNSGYGSSAVAYGCRAWVNFDGTGTVAIRASGNVSSITDNGVGTYTVNFTNSMPDVNYAAVVSGGTGAGNANNNNSPGNTTPTSSAFPIQTFDFAFTLADWAYNQVAIFR